MGWIRAILAGLGLANDRAPVVFDANDPAIRDAARKAQETFPQFVDRLRDPQPSDSGFLVKIRLTDGAGAFESIWAEHPAADGETWTATLVNVPRLPGYRQGQRVSFSRDELADWCFWEGDRMTGGFSHEAMLQTLPPNERARMRQQLGL